RQVRFWPRSLAPAAFAKHSYGRMLSLFHRAGVTKLPHETPLEFLERLNRSGVPGYTEAAIITHCFCQQAYARQQLSPEARQNVDSALQALRPLLQMRKAHRSQPQRPALPRS